MSKGTVYDWTKETVHYTDADGKYVSAWHTYPNPFLTPQYPRKSEQPEFFRLLNLNMEQRTGDEPV